MSSLLSRVVVHVFLASVTALTALLVVEWLLPGSVTTSMPLYPVAAGGVVLLLMSAPFVREAPFWKQVVGTLLWCVPLMALVGAFAINEGRGAFFLSAGLTLALVGVMIVGVTLNTDEPST